jgi:predicted XRE-type DNA-binding protein
MKLNNSENILNQPSYWVEKVNASIYNSIIEFMEENKMKKKDLAVHLGISKGRVSQILNDGNINFSIEKVIQIALKVGVFPDFNFENKDAYLRVLNSDKVSNELVINYVSDEIFFPKNAENLSTVSDETKVISILSFQEDQIAL